MMRKQIGAALSAVLLLTALTMPAAAAEYDYNIEDGSVQNATRYPVAKAYTLTDILYDLGASGGMSQPQDLYIGPDGRLYVADTGNNRILRFYQDRRVRLPLSSSSRRETGSYCRRSDSQRTRDRSYR